MKALLKTVVAVVTAGMAMFSMASEFKIGRATLVLPDGNWVVLSENDASNSYGGDASGNIPAQAKWLALVDNNNQILALLGVRAAGSAVAGVKMSWNDRCKAQQNQTYHYDATRGSLQDLDCLRSWESGNFEAWLKRFAPKNLEAVNEKGYKLPTTPVQFRHDIGTDNGTFINSTLFLASNFQGLPTGGPLQTNTTGREELARWLEAYAVAARSSARSFSGNLVVPAINFSSK